MSIVRSYRAWRMRRLAKRAKRLFRILDRHMGMMKWPRWRRRQWWRDYIKEPFHGNLLDVFEKK